jgi:8-oxo-dGTP pyrophosphatase MutT (NUDIX family)
MPEPPRLRSAARVVVVDPEGRVLLFGSRLVDLQTPPGPVLYWYTPGGRTEPGESARGTAVRELAEENGLVVDPRAHEGPVWLRRAVATLMGVPYDHRETYFVLRDVVHEVDVRGQTQLEAYEDQPWRWWSVAEIAASEEIFVPRELARALPEVLAGPWTGPPRIVD